MCSRRLRNTSGAKLINGAAQCWSARARCRGVRVLGAGAGVQRDARWREPWPCSAPALLAAAAYDREVNCRRAAAAAFQVQAPQRSDVPSPIKSTDADRLSMEVMTSPVIASLWCQRLSSDMKASIRLLIAL